MQTPRLLRLPQYSRPRSARGLHTATAFTLALVTALACDENAPTETRAPSSPTEMSASSSEVDGAVQRDVSTMAIVLPVNQSIATASPAPAFRINQTGTGPNGIFQITRAASTQTALQGLTNGRGRAGFFQTTNATNTQPALQAQTNGSGFAVHGLATGTGGAGSFQINNASNTVHALTAITNGTGGAANFLVNNSLGSGSALQVTTNGRGPAGLFQTTNTTNDAPTLQAQSNGNNVAIQGLATGAGVAGVFQLNNSGGTQSALTVLTNGAAPAVHGINSRSGEGGMFESVDGVALNAVTSGNDPAGLFQINAAPEINPDVLQVFGNQAAANPKAARFGGDVHVQGTLTKTSGAFRIDHPLDPEHKYLSHSFIESPDMMNVYNGNVTLDANGRATVELPDYFEALNKDFRYQLTAVGSPGPNLYIAEGVKQNRFRIAGGRPYAHVSWQVTGVRQDVYAEQNRIKVEEEKPPAERGLIARR